MPELVVRRPGVSPPPPAKLPSKRWRDLILRVWHVDPLRCPVCQNPMRVIAVIDNPRAVEQILRHLGPGTTRHPDRRHRASRAHTPTSRATMSDPAPDYENVLTD